MGIFDSNYDFNKYRVFYAVAYYKSFSKASKVLHISQPAISYSIKELEKQLETKLFIRDKNNIMLTDNAEKLLVYVKKAFDSILLGQEIIENKKNNYLGTVRIGIYSHIAQLILPNIIKDFTKINPNVKFHVYSTSNEEMINKLNNKELDLLILLYPAFLNNKNFNEEPLFKTSTCFYANKKYYDMYLKNNFSFKGIPILLAERGYPDIDNFEKIVKRNNISLDNKITTYTTELRIRLIMLGMGASWGIKKFIEPYIKSGEIYELPINFKIPDSEFSLVYDDAFLNDTNKEFIKYLKENIYKYI